MEGTFKSTEASPKNHNNINLSPKAGGKNSYESVVAMAQDVISKHNEIDKIGNWILNNFSAMNNIF